MLWCCLHANSQAPVQAADDASRLADLRAALGKLPVQAATGLSELQVLDWRTREPATDAVVVEMPEPRTASVIAASRKGPRSWQEFWLREALERGVRVALDDRGIARLHGSPNQAVVVRGVCFDAVDGLLAIPCPLMPIEVEVVDAQGRPQPGVQIRDGAGATDARGRGTLWPDYRTLASGRFLAVTASRLGVHVDIAISRGLPMLLPFGAAVVDTLDPAAIPQPLRLRLPRMAKLELCGEYQGKPEEFRGLKVVWSPPFGDRAELDCGPAAAALATGLTPDVPVTVWGRGVVEQRVVPRADATVRVVLQLRGPRTGVRYRLLDDQRRPLLGGRADGGGCDHDPKRGEVVFDPTDQEVLLRLQGDDGEEWSCAPFRLQGWKGPGIDDGGELVLAASSRTPYCSGIVLDAQQRPVQAKVHLGDDHGGYAGAQSGADGRFLICIGPWFRGPVGLRAPRIPTLDELTVSRGDHDVVVHVDPDGTNWPTIHGRLLDLPVPCSLRTLLLVTAVDDASGRGPREGWFRPDGSFTVSCRPGTYSVSVGLPDGTPLFGARGVVVGPNRDVHPPDLQRKLPADLRLARVRLLDGAGRPLTLRAQSMDSTRYFLLPLGGADVALPYLQPMHLDGDRDITLDPAVVELRIDGLEPIGGWQFGARLCSATGRDFEREVRLEQGRARMLVLRGIAMRIELLAQRYQEQGVQPLTPALLSGFAGGFQVAPGSTEPVVLRAPTDLREQLQALDQQAKSR